MKEVDKVNQLINCKEKHTAEKWKVILLTQIASSLAVIADKLCEGKE